MGKSAASRSEDRRTGGRHVSDYDARAAQSTPSRNQFFSPVMGTTSRARASRFPRAWWKKCR